MTPSGNQVSAARSLAGWDRKSLAKIAGLSDVTIRYVENETKAPTKTTIDKIVTAFRNAGIEFIDNDGVRRLPASIEIFEGRDRFDDFSNFMYDYLGRFGGEVYLSVTDERYIQRARKDPKKHSSIMNGLVDAGKVTGRILAADGDLKQGWAELRRQPLTTDMAQVSFYAFGDNLALISFDHKKPPYVVLHKSGPFAAAYKTAFDAAWDKAEILV